MDHKKYKSCMMLRRKGQKQHTHSAECLAQGFALLVPHQVPHAIAHSQ